MVNISRIDESLPLPQHQTDGSCAFDFVVRETTIVPPKGTAKVPANVIIQVPENMALLVLPRSSTFDRWGVQFPHGVGLVDQDYCGPTDEIKLLLWNPFDEPKTIPRGERLAQGLLVNGERAEFRETKPSEASRGGFGSTN